MTAIVGILNKHAAAMATDSAVTIDGQKVFNSANKLFVYIEKRDSVFVQTNTALTDRTDKKSGFLTYVKWIFALICAIVVLIITIKVCLRRL